MRTYRDAKAMARALRAALAERAVSLGHSDCLELVARQFEADDWNTLSARIERDGGGDGEASRQGSVRLSRAIPILRIFDEAKAREFYVDFLGFKVDWEHRFHPGAPLYMQVSRPEILLHLSEHHGDASPGSTVFVWMRGITAYNRQLLAQDYKYYRPGVEKAPWNALSMEVGDPFGNRLRFSEPNDPDDPRA